MNEQPLIVVITATTGRDTLKDTIESVQNQTYPNIKHIIVCDGKAHQEKVASIIAIYKDTSRNIEQITIPWQTGLDRWNGHRIYAAIPHLITEDAYISFLDDDNYIDPTHYEDLYNAIKETDDDSEWGYSLRKIVSTTKEFIANDMCESLGYLSKTSLILWYEVTEPYKNELVPNDPQHYLIDANCYLLSKTLAQKIAHNWQYPARHEPEVDRLLFQELKKYKGICSMKYTVNYRIDSRSDSAIPEFYILGNQYMNTVYNNQIPWAPIENNIK